jgi:hypothetical protein
MKDKPKREKKKKKGEFSKKNKARRQYLIAGMLGGKEWADKCVEDGKINEDM